MSAHATARATTPPSRAAHGLDDELRRAAEEFAAQRPRLLRVASRVTRGDAASAEDVVQEVWLRWQRTDRSAVRNPDAFLTTTATRLAINVTQAASHRHETPSEALTDGVARSGAGDDPAARAGATAEVGEAVHLLMARLTRGELAAYVLRKAFGYDYAEVARILRTSAANARQLVRRAGVRVAGGPRRRPVDLEVHRRLTAAFLVGARTGELRPLERLLAERA